MQTLKSLTLDDTRAIAEAAESYAAEQGLAVAIVVVDRSSFVQFALRMDGAGLMTIDAATAKARWAVGTGRPTALWSKVLMDGDLSVLTIPGVSPVPGGVPVEVGGQICGAVGVSGVAPHLDAAVAETGSAAVSAAGSSGEASNAVPADA